MMCGRRQAITQMYSRVGRPRQLAVDMLIASSALTKIVFSLSQQFQPLLFPLEVAVMVTTCVYIMWSIGITMSIKTTTTTKKKQKR